MSAPVPSVRVLCGANHSAFREVLSLSKGGNVSKWKKLCLGLAILTIASVPVWGQGAPPPIPDGGVFPSAFLNLGGNL